MGHRGTFWDIPAGPERNPVRILSGCDKLRQTATPIRAPPPGEIFVFGAKRCQIGPRPGGLRAGAPGQHLCFRCQTGSFRLPRPGLNPPPRLSGSFPGANNCERMCIGPFPGTGGRTGPACPIFGRVVERNCGRGFFPESGAQLRTDRGDGIWRFFGNPRPASEPVGLLASGRSRSGRGRVCAAQAIHRDGWLLRTRDNRPAVRCGRVERVRAMGPRLLCLRRP